MAVKDEFLFEKIGEMRNGYLEKLPAGGEEHIFPDGFEKKACGAKGISRIMLRRLAVAAVAAVLVFTAAAEGLPKERSFVSGGVAVSVTEYPKYIRMECKPADEVEQANNVVKIGWVPEGYKEISRDKIDNTVFIRLKNEKNKIILISSEVLTKKSHIVIGTEDGQYTEVDVDSGEGIAVIRKDQSVIKFFREGRLVSVSGELEETEAVRIAEDLKFDMWRWKE